MPVVEIRSYRLMPGCCDQFHLLLSQQSLPLMLDWSMDVLDFGPSLHDADGHFLIRGGDKELDADRQHQHKIELFYLPSYSSELNPQEHHNAKGT